LTESYNYQQELREKQERSWRWGCSEHSWGTWSSWSSLRGCRRSPADQQISAHKFVHSPITFCCVRWNATGRRRPNTAC